MTAFIMAGVALAFLVAWAVTLIHPAPVPHSIREPLSPLDEAERILTARHARGTISRQEYELMLAILRR